MGCMVARDTIIAMFLLISHFLIFSPSPAMTIVGSHHIAVEACDCDRNSVFVFFAISLPFKRSNLRSCEMYELRIFNAIRNISNCLSPKIVQINFDLTK